jgi:hypothetical protein
MGNKQANDTRTSTPPLEVLTQELLSSLQGRSRTRADTCMLRAEKIQEKMLKIEKMAVSSCTCQDSLSSSTPKVPLVSFDSSLQKLLELLDGVEQCRLKIPLEQRPEPFLTSEK